MSLGAAVKRDWTPGSNLRHNTPCGATLLPKFFNHFGFPFGFESPFRTTLPPEDPDRRLPFRSRDSIRKRTNSRGSGQIARPYEACGSTPSVATLPPGMSM